MLVQIGENSTTLTPFGSLASARDEDHGTRNAGTNDDRRSAFKLALRRIFNLFAAASATSNDSK
jgi:hypothetical protein